MAGTYKQLQVEGVEELIKQLGGLKQLGAAMAPARMAAAEYVQGILKQEAPVDDGDLRDGIEINPSVLSKRGKNTTLVAANHRKAPHAHLVEFGARGGQMPANPFFSRGYLKSRGGAQGILAAGAKAAADRAIK